MAEKNFSNSPLAKDYLLTSNCYRNDRTSLPTKITIHITGSNPPNPSLKGL